MTMVSTDINTLYTTLHSSVVKNEGKGLFYGASNFKLQTANGSRIDDD